MKEINMQTKLDAFTEAFKSVVLSTVSKEGTPYASYTPFIKHESAYYLLMASQATHYQNVISNQKVSLLFIEDESKAKSIFFRERLIYTATAEEVEISPPLREKLSKELGQMIDQLIQMHFVLVKTTIIQGQFIIGPGAAYLVDEQQKIATQMTGGHKSK
ncbi:MAG: pyridoxamine 5'-phosphate oxidase family protein [Acholeplasmataceae bacterium]